MNQLIDILRREINAATINDALAEADATGEPGGSFDAKHAADCLIDRLMQELHCADCDGNGAVHDPDNEDYNQDVDGFTYCGGWMLCPSCHGTGFAFDVSPVDDPKLGVQAIPGLTSTASRGAAITSQSAAETPALSSDIDAINAAVAILIPLRMEAAMRNDSAAWRILDGACMYLAECERKLLTSEVGQ